jgi:hypothetical protein
MTSINLVQQEQIHVLKMLKPGASGAAPFDGGIMGAPPGFDQSSW